MSDKILGLPEFLTKEQLEYINKKTPDECKKQRKSGYGKELTYVEVGYVINVLNKVFGHNWDFIIENEEIGKLQVWVKGKLIIRLSNGGTIEKQHYGGSDIKKYKEKYFVKGKGWIVNPRGGEPISIADDLKAAASDCLKKCASILGIAGDVFFPQLENWDREENKVKDVDPDWIKGTDKKTKKQEKLGG